MWLKLNVTILFYSSTRSIKWAKISKFRINHFNPGKLWLMGGSRVCGGRVSLFPSLSRISVFVINLPLERAPPSSPHPAKPSFHPKSGLLCAVSSSPCTEGLSLLTGINFFKKYINICRIIEHTGLENKALTWLWECCRQVEQTSPNYMTRIFSEPSTEETIC